MRRSGVIALLMLLTLWLTGIPTYAGKGWCRSDPIVRINGADLQVWVAIPIDDLPDVIGPIQIELVAPRGSLTELVYVDDGFNGFGEAFRWAQGESTVVSDGTFTVTARVSVPIRDGRYVPMQVELISENGIASAVYGETVGVEIDVTLHGSRIAQTTVRGASVTGVSVNGEGGSAARGGDAVGGSATGADAAGTWVSTQPSPAPSPADIKPVEPSEPSPIAPENELPGEVNDATPATSNGAAGFASPTPDAAPGTADDQPLDAPEGLEAGADTPSAQDAGEMDAVEHDTQAMPETPEATASNAANDLETPAAESAESGPPDDGDTTGQQPTESAERLETVERSEEAENAASATPTPDASLPEPLPDADENLARLAVVTTPVPTSDEASPPDATAEGSPPATADAPSCVTPRPDEPEEDTSSQETECARDAHS